MNIIDEIELNEASIQLDLKKLNYLIGNLKNFLFLLIKNKKLIQKII